MSDCGFVVAVSARRPPRSDNDVIALRHMRQEIRYMLYGHSEVGVAHKAVFAGGGQHAMPHRRALAAVRDALQAKAVALRHPVGHNRRRGVDAAVIYYDYLPGVGLFG